MKKSLPNIVSYEVLKKEYSNIKLYNPREFFVFTDDDNLPSKSDPSFKKSLLGEGETLKQNVLDTLDKYKFAIEEIEAAMLELVQHQTIKNPKVYVARSRDVKTDIEYLLAKTFFPLKDGRRKEVKIYLGKAEFYNNDTKNLRAISDATIKMINTLNRRVKEGSL